MHYSFILNLYKNFFIVPYTALHVSGILVSIIRSLALCTAFAASGTVCRCFGCVFSVVKQHSKNTQPEQRHTVSEAANAVQKCKAPDDGHKDARNM
jgi:hypothetical protein